MISSAEGHIHSAAWSVVLTWSDMILGEYSCSFWVLRAAFFSKAFHTAEAEGGDRDLLPADLCSRAIDPSKGRTGLTPHLSPLCLFWPSTRLCCPCSSKGSALKTPLVNNILINNQVSSQGSMARSVQGGNVCRCNSIGRNKFGMKMTLLM